MHLPINEMLRTNFPYTMTRHQYPGNEYTRLTSLCDKWTRRLTLAIVGYLLVYIAAITYILWSLNSFVYSLLPDADWFPQDVAPFAIPGLLLALPLALLTAYQTMSVFTGNDYTYITDLMNARAEYDGNAAAKGVLRVFGVIAVIITFFVSWSYVRVSDDGFSIKNAGSFSSVHYNFSSIISATHYTHYVHDGKTEPDDRYELKLDNGSTVYLLSPFVDHRRCAIAIIKHGGLTVLEE